VGGGEAAGHPGARRLHLLVAGGWQVLIIGEKISIIYNYNNMSLLLLLLYRKKNNSFM
jgi:hypothetical protein